MKRFILLAIIALFLGSQAFAADNNDLLERLQSSRTEIYASLQLTPNQKARINQLDNQVYQKLESDLQEVSLHINKIQELANSPDCSIDKVNAIQADFKIVENRISAIKDEYEIEFNKILTPKQQDLYKSAKLKQQAKLEKEMQALKSNL